MKAGPLCVAHCVLYVLSSFTCPSRKNPNPNLPTSNSVYIRRARPQTFKHLVLQTVALARGTIRTSCVIALRRATSDFLPTHRTFCAVTLCELCSKTDTSERARPTQKSINVSVYRLAE